MRLEKRIQTLEAKMLSERVILHFADGSTESLFGRRYFLLDLFSGAYGGSVSPEQATQLDLIRKCVRAQEPGGGRLVELMQSVMGSPEKSEDGCPGLSIER